MVHVYLVWECHQWLQLICLLSGPCRCMPFFYLCLNKQQQCWDRKIRTCWQWSKYLLPVDVGLPHFDVFLGNSWSISWVLFSLSLTRTFSVDVLLSAGTSSADLFWCLDHGLPRMGYFAATAHLAFALTSPVSHCFVFLYGPEKKSKKKIDSNACNELNRDVEIWII